MDNKIRNDVNFTARLDLSKLKINKERWERIGESFNLRTPDFPNDVFVLRGDADSLTLTNTNPEYTVKPMFMIFDEGFERLQKISDSEVIDKLRKLLHISKKAGEVQKESENALNKLFGMADGNRTSYAEVLNSSNNAQIKELELDNMINQLTSDDVLANTIIKPY